MALSSKVIATFIFAIVSGSSLGLEKFESEDQFYGFYRNWVSTDDVEKFRSTQRALIDGFANKTVDPCENFYEFACGRYREVFPNHLSKRGDKFPFMPKKLFLAGWSQIKEMFKEKPRDDDTKTTKKLKLLYETCTDSNAWKPTEVGTFIKSMAAWPILTENWNGDGFDWMNVSGHLGLYMLEQFFERDTKIQDGLVRFVFKKTIFSEDSLQNGEIMSHLNFTSLTFSEGDNDALKQFYMKLVDLPDDLGYEKEYTLSELKEVFPKIDFEQYLRIVYQRDQMPSNEVVIIRDPAYFKALSTVLAETDRRTIANFMFLKVVSTVSKLGALYGDTVLCYYWILVSFMPAVSEAYMNRYHVKGDAAKELMQIFNGVREQTILAASTPDDRAARMSEFEEYNLTMPIYDPYSNLVEKYYSNYEVNRSSFIQSLLGYQKAHAEQQLRIEFAGVDIPFNLRIVSSEGQDKYLIDISALLPPVFHVFSTPAENYAGIGNIFTKVLLRTLRSFQSATSLSSSVKCFYKKNNIKDSDPEELIQETALQAEALSLTYNALLKRFANSGTPNASKRFFLGVVQTECDDNEQKKSHHLGSGGILDVLANSAEFSAAFNCPVGSKMNPDKTC